MSTPLEIAIGHSLAIWLVHLTLHSTCILPLAHSESVILITPNSISTRSLQPPVFPWSTVPITMVPGTQIKGIKLCSSLPIVHWMWEGLTKLAYVCRTPSRFNLHVHMIIRPLQASLRPKQPRPQFIGHRHSDGTVEIPHKPKLSHHKVIVSLKRIFYWITSRSLIFQIKFKKDY